MCREGANLSDAKRLNLPSFTVCDCEQERERLIGNPTSGEGSTRGQRGVNEGSTGRGAREKKSGDLSYCPK